jgi:DNA-binding MarR family transcriptional regulator
MNSNDEQPVIDYQTMAELRYQIRRFLRFSEQVARSAGIEPQQYQSLLAVKGLPESKKPTVGEPAERLQIQHNSMVELVNRLVEHALVERQRDESDQRLVIVTLTARGEQVLQQLALYHRTELASAAGISAVFATPVAAVLLVVELLHFEWEPRRIIPVAIASATVIVMRRYLLGQGTLNDTFVIAIWNLWNETKSACYKEIISLSLLVVGSLKSI